MFEQMIVPPFPWVQFRHWFVPAHTGAIEILVVVNVPLDRDAAPAARRPRCV
jgi:hypothetical protein